MVVRTIILNRLSKMFISLPENLLRCIIGEWLEIKFIARLDSACCFCQYRPKLLKVFESVAIACVDIFDIELTMWMMLRRVTATKVNIHADFGWSQHETLSEFLTFCQESIHSLHIVAWYFSCFDIAVATCYHLTEFDYSCGLLYIPLLFALLKRNTHLRTLSFQLDLAFSTDFAGLSLPELRHLSVSVYREANPALTGALISRAPNLQKLTISHYANYRTTAVVTSYCAHLKSLKLLQVQRIDDTLVQIVQFCPHIMHLDLSDCYNLTDRGVKTVAQHLHSLCSLDLSRCRNITDIALQHLAEHSVHMLETLKLTSHCAVTRAGVASFRQQCTKLSRFRFIDECMHTTTTFRTLSDVVSDAKTNVVVINSAINDDHILTSAGACDSVEILHLCGGYTNELFPSAVGLADLCAKWPNLNTIVVHEVDYAKAKEAVRGLPQLTVTTEISVYEHDLMSI